MSIAGIIVNEVASCRQKILSGSGSSFMWVISHSDPPRYVVCAEDIRFVYLFRCCVSATDVLRAHDYAIWALWIVFLICVLTY